MSTTPTTEPTESHLRAQLKLHFSAAIACGELADTDVAYIVDLAENVASVHVAEHADQLAEKDAEIEQWKDCHRVMQQSAVLQAKLKDDARAQRDAAQAQVAQLHKTLGGVMGCLREGWIPEGVYADAKDALAAMQKDAQ